METYTEMRMQKREKWVALIVPTQLFVFENIYNRINGIYIMLLKCNIYLFYLSLREPVKKQKSVENSTLGSALNVCFKCFSIL